MILFCNLRFQCVIETSYKRNRIFKHSYCSHVITSRAYRAGSSLSRTKKSGRIKSDDYNISKSTK